MKTHLGKKNASSAEPAPTQNSFSQSSPTSAYAPLRKLKKILVPIDFSEASLKALRYAVPFAEQFGATVSLVHVVEPASYPVDLPAVSPAALAVAPQDEARKKLFTLSYREIEELVPVDVHVPSGKPAEEIVNLAKDLETDLIVISTNGYQGLKHLVMGSTAEKVVRAAPCPVLVVREKEHEFI